MQIDFVMRVAEEYIQPACSRKVYKIFRRHGQSGRRVGRLTRRPSASTWMELRGGAINMKGSGPMDLSPNRAG